MRPRLVHGLAAHDLPGWLVPDYAMMVALAGVVGAFWVLRLTRRDGADVAATRRALAVGYLCALFGGYLIELLRVALVALISHAPLQPFGRAAYGGLLFGVAGAAYVMHRRGRALLPFLDRLSVVLGLAFVFVRGGCFLAGCDFGKPTASALGVRFPPHSSAALEHARRGWVPDAAASLPVHPTQLYEAALAAVALMLALIWLRRGYRDGRAIGSWLMAYALGRLWVEQLRDDPARGIYAGLSSAQLISIVVMLAVLLLAARQRRRSSARGLPGQLSRFTPSALPTSTSSAMSRNSPVSTTPGMRRMA